MISSLGALIGSLVCSKLNNKYSFNKLILTIFSLHILFRLLFIILNIKFIHTLSMFFIHSLASILNILIISNRQKHVDKRYLGRVNSIYKTVLIGMNSLGFVYGGLLTKSIGVKNSMLISTLLLLIFTIFSVVMLLQKKK